MFIETFDFRFRRICASVPGIKASHCKASEGGVQLPLPKSKRTFTCAIGGEISIDDHALQLTLGTAGPFVIVFLCTTVEYFGKTHMNVVSICQAVLSSHLHYDVQISFREFETPVIRKSPLNTGGPSVMVLPSHPVPSRSPPPLRWKPQMKPTIYKHLLYVV